MVLSIRLYVTVPYAVRTVEDCYTELGAARNVSVSLNSLS
jgi:hypothetical protein